MPSEQGDPSVACEIMSECPIVSIAPPRRRRFTLGLYLAFRHGSLLSGGRQYGDDRRTEVPFARHRCSCAQRDLPRFRRTLVALRRQSPRSTGGGDGVRHDGLPDYRARDCIVPDSGSRCRRIAGQRRACQSVRRLLGRRGPRTRGKGWNLAVGMGCQSPIVET